MLKTGRELAVELAESIRLRRSLMGWTQQEAAARAGVAYRTWRRMEHDGSASIEDCIRAAIALRCEAGLGNLFPEPAAASLDDLLQRQTPATGRSRSPGSKANRS